MEDDLLVDEGMSEMERPNSSTALISSGVGKNRMSVDDVVVLVEEEEEDAASMNFIDDPVIVLSSSSSSSLSETIAELFRSSASAPYPSTSTECCGTSALLPLLSKIYIPR